MTTVVALSGGKDSTAMALRLAEVEPDADYHFVCTPTGNELPAMFAHWGMLRRILPGRFVPLTAGTLESSIERNKMIPNARARFCTRELKLAPFAGYLMRLAGEIVSCVGIRADEPEREGGDYSAVPGVVQRFPLREWGWGLADVQGYLADRGVDVPLRTDCAWCFFQRLGEWWDLWRDHPSLYADAEALEAKYGHTFRSPSRDTQPTSLRELRERFEAGYIPRGSSAQLSMFGDTRCRVCRI